MLSSSKFCCLLLTEYPKHMFWLRNKKDNFQLRPFILGPGKVEIYLYRPNFQRKTVNIFISISLNICFGCSKELSH